MSHLELTDQNFENQILKSPSLAVVDFWAEWCGPCKVLSPIVEEVARELPADKVKIGKLNVDENGDTATKFSVMSIPTLLFFKGGKIVDQVIGVISKSELLGKINKLLAQ